MPTPTLSGQPYNFSVSPLSAPNFVHRRVIIFGPEGIAHPPKRYRQATNSDFSGRLLARKKKSRNNMVRNERSSLEPLYQTKPRREEFWSDIPTYHCHSHGGVARNSEVRSSLPQRMRKEAQKGELGDQDQRDCYCGIVNDENLYQREEDDGKRYRIE